MTITRREWLVAFGVACAAVGLALIPYVLGYVSARPGTVFTGVIMNPEDSNSYLAKMLQGYEGRWLYTIPFTSEDHAPAFVGGFYIVLGQIARALSLQLVAVWHGSRIVAGLILYMVTFGFVAGFVEDGAARWGAYLLGVYGSGLGWVLFLMNQPYWLGAYPVDFKMPESHLFFSVLTYPHVAFGAALVATSAWFTKGALEGLQRPAGAWKYALGAGVSNLILAVVYPFLIYLVVAVMTGYLLLRALRARRILFPEIGIAAVTVLIPAPLVVYYAATLWTNPVFAAWDAQAVTPSPPLPHYLIAYGVLLLLAALTLWHGMESRYDLLWAWVAAVAILVYAPLNPQRRFVEGIQIPLAILAVAGWQGSVLPFLGRRSGFQRLAKRPGYSIPGLERFLLVGLISISSLSNLYVLARLALTTAVEQPFPLFWPQTLLQGVDWMASNTPHRALVLGAYETGNQIAASAGNRVLLGHWAETLDWAKRFDQVAWFYSPRASDAERRQFLERELIEYVWVGPVERRLGAFDPAGVDYLVPAFSNADLTIYRVRP